MGGCIVNYYPFHIGDFRSGTVNMSRQSRWVYRDMLDVYYDSEKPLTLDLDVLCDEIGAETSDERKIVERLLRFKFEKTDDGYRHTICDRVISEYHQKAETAKANGKLGGRPPKAKAGEKEPSGLRSGSDRDATGKQSASGSEANQEPITNNQEPEEKNLVALGAQAGDADQPSATDPVGVVFAHWQKAMESPRSRLDNARKKLIKAALKMGYPVEDLCAAIDGCRKSPHHMGKNDQGMKYNGLDLILRSADYIDKFIVIGRSPLVPAPAKGQNSQFHFAGVDRSGDRAAMEESMRRHNVQIPETGEIEI
jgi:uncharacterized protein YdaU (DUF1376 family)